jgi:lipopolysaccharide export system protein LptA
VRFTIERIRTLVLAAGVLLVVALGVFLAIGRFRSPFSRRDIPKRLGIDIQQEANGVTYTQAHGGHTLFKIHASKVVQLKNDHAQLHDVEIELYGADGSRVDRIQGDEFEYDQKEGTARATGPVEMTLMRPSSADAQPAGGNVPPAKGSGAPEGQTPPNEILVKTSGITFDQKSGVVTTAERVDFSSGQGSGSSMGAMYDSNQGFLVLQHAVELTSSRGQGGEPVEIHADRAAFERDANRCNLSAASANYRGGRATANAAQILFRDDGTAVRLEATEGFTLATAGGSHLAAPTGAMDFDEHNQPRHGHLEGGVTMDSVSDGRTVHGASPTMELEFTPQGELRHAHLERGVAIDSEETSAAAGNGQAGSTHMSRTWRSPVADIEFQSVQGRGRAGQREGQGANQGKAEPRTIHGFGGVVLTGVTQRGDEAPSRSRLAADEVDGDFAPGSALRHMTGAGHASLEETAAAGGERTASGDHIDAQFATPIAKTGSANAGTNAGQVESAVLTGHVVMTQTPAPGARVAQPIQAWAGKAVYEDAGEWLHLTMNPRIESGQSQITADKIDISRQSNEAFAHGNVKATYVEASGLSAAGAGGGSDASLGGHGPTHIVASEAEMNQSTGSATFRGHARLWQLANSISGPVIVLDHQRQTLTAQTASAADPVTAVLLSAGASVLPAAGQTGPQPGESANKGTGKGTGVKTAAPAVIRVRGGEFAYSDAEHRAVMRGGVLGKVTAETGTATSTSSEVELLLRQGGARRDPEGSGLEPGGSGRESEGSGREPESSGPAQVDRLTATGHVVLTSQGRSGTGDELVYTGSSGDYVLTGSPAAPPKMTDPQRGTVTGTALIFHSRDDSVSIEGGAQETETETTAPK